MARTFDANTQRIADAVRPLLKREEGKIVYTNEEANVEIATLPEGLSAEVVQQVREHRSNVIAGTALAFKDAALDALADDSKLEDVNGAFALVGDDEVAFNIARQASFPNPKDPKTPVIKHGQFSAKFVTRDSASRGDLGLVKTHASEEALKRFAKA